MSRNEYCTACPLHRGENITTCLWGDGPKDASIVFIGEAPGETEDRAGKPFLGDAGQLLNRLFEKAGLSRDQVYITNAVKCRPPGNRTPTQEEVKACSTYLMEEIGEIQPKVIVTLGGSALKALSGKSAVGENRGRLLAAKPGVRLGEATIIGTYHPAAYLHQHNNATLDAIVDDVKLAMRIAGVGAPEASQSAAVGKHQALLYGARLTTANIERALSALDDAPFIACDLEWTGNNDGRMRWPWVPNSYVHSMSFAGRVRGQITSVGIAFPVDKNAFKVIQAFFDAHPMIFHNAQADLLWLRKLGYRVRLAGDTMVLAHLCDEGQALSLEALVMSKAHVLPGWKKPVWPQAPSTDEEWFELLGHNVGDVEATIMLMESLQAELKGRPKDEQINIRRLYKELVLPAVVTFTELGYNGVPVDRQDLRSIIQEERAQVDGFAKELSDLAGIDPATAEKVAMSNTQTPKFLSSQFNIRVGGSSKAALEDYQGMRPVQLIQAIRHGRKNLGTYYEPWLELALQDGRLHSLYRQTLRTGRTAAELEVGGSLQVAPREKKTKALIKARPGWKLVSADESQLELRTAAWLAGERTMLQLYQEDADIHRSTAAFITAFRTKSISLQEFWPQRVHYEAVVTPDERQGAKGVNFGLVFGMQPEKLVVYCRTTYGVVMTLEEAEKAHIGYFTLYRDLQPWHERCIQEWRDRGYILTEAGRYRRHATDATQSINTPVQSLAGDIVQLAMVEIHREFTRLHMRSLLCGFVHDSVIAESPDEEAEAARDIIVKHLEHPPLDRLGIKDVPVPFKADWKIGQNWAE